MGTQSQSTRSAVLHPLAGRRRRWHAPGSPLSQKSLAASGTPSRCPVWGSSETPQAHPDQPWLPCWAELAGS